MPKTKSSKKDATNAEKCNMNDTKLKYQFFPTLAKVNKRPEETVESFMNRIGMGRRRPDYQGFRSGNKNVTEKTFNDIRTAFRWSVSETEKWETLWEEDQKIKALRTKKAREMQQGQPTQQELETNALLRVVAKDEQVPVESEVRVLCHCEDVRRKIVGWRTLGESRHLLNDPPLERFLEFVFFVADNDPEMFASTKELDWSWFRGAVEKGLLEFAGGVEPLLEFLQDRLGFSGDVALWVVRGRLSRPLRLLAEEYRANIFRHTEKNASKVNGNSGY